MSKYCEYCGKELRDNALFCSGCGKSVAAPSFQEPKTPPARPEKKAKGKPEKKAKEKPAKKRKPIFSGINVLLVILLIIQTAVAGFKWPGYFTKRTGGLGQEIIGLLEKEEVPDQESLLKEIESIDYDELAQMDDVPITKETSPGNPALIETTWSEEEIANAEAQEKAFTWEEAYAEVSTSNGTVSAEFNGWDLNEDDDALIVHTLGQKNDDASEMTLFGYDLSLASGQHEFTSHNIITIPRMSGDDRDSYVAYYNPDSGSYEPVYYEISEDRKSYHVYLDHFSTVVEAIPKYLKPEFFNGNVFYEPDYESAIAPMDRRIALSEEALDAWAEKNAVDLLKLAADGIKSEDLMAASLGVIDIGNSGDDILKLGKAASKTGILKKLAGNLGYLSASVKGVHQAMIDGDILGFGRSFAKDNWASLKDVAATAASQLGGMLVNYPAP